MAGILDSFLGSLGQGLQTAGGILSPDVYQNQVDQQKQLLIAKQRQQELTQQLAARAIESGALDPANAQGLGLPQGLGMDATNQARIQKAKIDQEAAQTVAPYLDKGDYKGALGALSKLPGGLNSQPAVHLMSLIRSQSMGGNQMQGKAVGGSLAVPDQTQPGGIRWETPPAKPVEDKPQSTIGKLSADLKAGRISQKEYDLELKKMTNVTNVNVSVPMSEDAMDLGARQYLATGQMPPMGMGKSGAEVRAKIMEKAARLAKDQGTDLGDIPGQRAQFKANAGALSALSKDVAALEPYKKMLDLNGNIAIDLGRKIQNTNAAIANKPINWLKQNASNNPDVAEYMFQINTLQAEAARVLNNPRLVGQMSYEATKDMQTVLNGNMPIPAAERVIRRMQTDGANRLSSMQKKQESLNASLRGNPVAKAAEHPAATVLKFDAQGNLIK